jgi:asparagine synthase (glutamine-hydrolysing)
MFAAAIWDADAGRLLLCRDRLGIKPLYYAPLDDGVAFASEQKCLLSGGIVDPAVDRRALAYHLHLRFAPSHTSPFAGIESLQPGSYLLLDRTDDGWTRTTGSYWSVADAGGDPPADPEAAVREALDRAVARQLVSDVPVGFYLSGGLDTSSVVAAADRLTDEPISTFCMGFADAAFDERADARAVADHVGTDHHELTIDGSFVTDFPEMIWHADEPKRNLYPYYVAREMSDHVTVALGGLGADELFGGYVYRHSRLSELQALREASAEARRVVAEGAARAVETVLAGDDPGVDGAIEDLDALRRADDPVAVYAVLNSSDVLGDVRTIRSRAFGPALGGGDGPETDADLADFDPVDWLRRRAPDATTDRTLSETAFHCDLTTKLPDDFLLVEDRTSMAHSLESRVPFLDNDLVDLALSLPHSGRFDLADDGPTAGKAVLRRAMRPRLPDTVFQKDKQGFTMPTYRFAERELLPHAEHLLADPHVVRAGLIDGDYVRDLLDRRPAERLVPHYKLLWRIVALEIWYQTYIVRGAEGPDRLESYYT